MTASGWGSREKARIALKKSKQVSKHDDNPMALSTIVKDINDEIVNAKPLAVSSESLQIAGPKGSNSRLVYLMPHCCLIYVVALLVSLFDLLAHLV